MNKIFIVTLIASLINFVPVSAEVITLQPENLTATDLNFCGYGIFAKRQIEIRERLNKNPNDAKAWHELGKIYYALEEYSDALAAFEKAVALEPDNAEFKRDRDNALKKVKNGAGKKSVPNFDGLG